ncbi:MAG TPA: ATPase, partial [Ktedonobacterales bacterium]|nr:ATPase [Ktedonobacterales bacterium]
YLAVYTNLPDIEQILLGQGDKLRFPGEPSQRYAITVGLTMRSGEVSHAMNAFRWLSDRAGAEWVQLFAADLLRLLRQRGKVGMLAELTKADPQFTRFFGEFTELIGPVGSKV